jgi:hypothetical protein
MPGLTTYILSTFPVRCDCDTTLARITNIVQRCNPAEHPCPDAAVPHEAGRRWEALSPTPCVATWGSPCSLCIIMHDSVAGVIVAC